MAVSGKRMLHILAALIVAAGISSCASSRKAIKEPLKAEGADYLFAKLKEHELKYTWLTAKFSAEYKNNGDEQAFGGQIRIRKDSLIWLSLSPMMGIEVMRLMISQDSIKYINRLNNTYFMGDYDYLNRFLKTNIDYDILQSFLIGNDLSFYEEGKFKADVDKGLYKLWTANREKLKKYVRSSEEALKVFIQNIWLDPETFKIVRADVKEMTDQKIKLEATYDEFEEISGQLFPKEMSYNIRAENVIMVKTSFSRIELDKPQQFPFKIPESYEKIR